MPRRRSFDVAETLRPELLGREAIQLAVVAAASVAVLLFAPGWLKLIAGIVDALVAIACLAGVVVAWRNERVNAALAVYAPAVAVFAALAVLNFWS